MKNNNKVKKEDDDPVYEWTLLCEKGKITLMHSQFGEFSKTTDYDVEIVTNTEEQTREVIFKPLVDNPRGYDVLCRFKQYIEDLQKNTN